MIAATARRCTSGPSSASDLARLAHPRVDGGPPVEAGQSAKSAFVHSAQRDGAARCRHRQRSCMTRAKGGHAGVRPGGVDRRDERHQRTGAPRCPRLGSIVNRIGDEPAAAPAMHPMLPSEPLRSRTDQHQPARPRHHAHPAEQPASLAIGGRMMSEHHSAAARQASQRDPQLVAHALVRHQPAGGWRSQA